MPVYAAPLADIRFIINEIVEFDALKEHLPFGEVTPDLIDAILEEAARLATEVLAPLNPAGDRRGAVFEDGRVTMPEGFIDAYRQFVEGGWNALPFPEDVGGQGLPYLLSTAVSEIWSDLRTCRISVPSSAESLPARTRICSTSSSVALPCLARVWRWLASAWFFCSVAPTRDTSP